MVMGNLTSFGDRLKSIEINSFNSKCIYQRSYTNASIKGLTHLPSYDDNFMHECFGLIIKIYLIYN